MSSLLVGGRLGIPTFGILVKFKHPLIRHPLDSPHQGGHATARFLEAFLEGAPKQSLLRRLLRRHLVRVAVRTGAFRRVLRRGGGIVIEGRNTPFRRVRPPLADCVRPSSGKKKAHKHKYFWPVTPPVIGGSPDREARGSKIYVLSSEFKEQ